MEKQAYVCKICNKRFKGGKAMGGHMRSHLAKLPLPPKSHPPPLPETPSLPQRLSHSPEFSSSSSPHHHLHHNNVMHTKTMHPPSMEVGDVTKRRSKRRRKMVVKGVPPPPEVSSCVNISNEANFSREECALSLVMLSRDTWKLKVTTNEKYIEEDSDHEEEEYEDEDEEEEENEDEDEKEEEDDVVFVARSTPKNTSSNNHGVSTPKITSSNNQGGKYKCDTCKKTFQSYQALGGHRASHKRIRQQVFKDDDDDDDEDDDVDDDVDDDESEEEEVVELERGGNNVQGYSGHCGIVEHPPSRVFECPICFKLFESGQALGGHKKVHYYNNTTNVSYYNTNNATRASSSSNNNLVIDLNLPAPEELYV